MWIGKKDGPYNAKEGSNIAKHWYREDQARAPKPCYATMEEQTNEREEIYDESTPEGLHIPINVNP